MSAARAKDRDGPVVLRPPLPVMQPKPVRAVPGPDDLPGGVRYEVKLDGYRCLAFANGAQPPVLQSRSGRNMAADYPGIAGAVALLPAGLVLDGELCAWKDGKLSFGGLRSRGPRGSRVSGADPAGVSLALVVFDVLALPGRDVRPLPLHQRVALLEDALRQAPPAIQSVLATTDPATARTWYTELLPQGIEGLVCKALDSPYEGGGAGRNWVKVRHQDTLDATVTAVTGTPRRPRHLVLRLPDASLVLTGPQLDRMQARDLADALADRFGEEVADPDFGPLHPLKDQVTVEVLAGTGRHATYRYLRLRAD